MLIFSCIITGIVILIVVFYLYSLFTIDGKIKKWYVEEFKKNNINEEDIKIKIGDDRNCVIFLKDKRLFYLKFVSPSKFEEIDINKILNIVIEKEYKYEGKQNIMTVVPQAEITGQEVGTILKIITEDDIYVLSTYAGYGDMMLQLKALLEKEKK